MRKLPISDIYLYKENFYWQLLKLSFNFQYLKKNKFDENARSTIENIKCVFENFFLRIKGDKIYTKKMGIHKNS